MLNIITSTLILILCMLSVDISAESRSVITVHFDEREKGIDPYPVRYIFAGNILRVDDNTNDGDFILYDDKKRVIYSVNHDDSTILVIENKDWKMPVFTFQRNVSWRLIEDAPAFDSKPVYNYWLSANEKVCTEAQVVEGFLIKEAHLLKRYRQTLSAGQVDAIAATPEDMRTPCLLIDNVYNTGSVYEKGFPIQQWHLNGLQRIMTTYKKDTQYKESLFVLPKDYKKYSMGDNLSFGER
ncbi:MAG: hypothetical protein OEY29_02355 [Gammaproteobacteria bacterium]|nr:hypothetical protein [Gammaproteobacteria bacterium]